MGNLILEAYLTPHNLNEKKKKNINQPQHQQRESADRDWVALLSQSLIRFRHSKFNARYVYFTFNTHRIFHTSTLSWAFRTWQKNSLKILYMLFVFYVFELINKNNKNNKSGHIIHTNKHTVGLAAFENIFSILYLNDLCFHQNEGKNQIKQKIIFIQNHKVREEKMKRKTDWQSKTII